MLAICDVYAAEYFMSFNAQKSKCLVILSNACRCLRPLLQDNMFYVDGKPIDFVSSFPHLGHVITDTLDDCPDITKKLENFIWQVNDVLCFFGKVSCDVKARLFRAYCISFYGCELWDLSDSSLSAFCTAWRKALRHIWNLPYRTYCHLLPLLCNCIPVFDEICKRSPKFLQTCLFHNTTLIRSVAQFSLTAGRNSSPCGRNAFFCVRRYTSVLSVI